MARKEDRSNRWIKSERVGEVTLFLSPRSPYWQMYWTTEQSQATGNGVRRRRSRKIHRESTRETDLAFARLVAGRKSEELFKCRHYPDREREQKRTRMEPVIDDFLKYIETLGRTHDYLSKLKGRLRCLREWMEKRKLHFVQDIDPPLLRSFQEYLRTKRRCSAATANHYLDAIHNFFGFVIFKRRLMPGPNPAATGRQAELDRLPHQVLSPPTIYPDQINAVIAVAVRHFDSQIVNIILFICEGGFRFQELQFLQVGDINLEEREIILDIKKPDLERVRPELRRRCLTADGLWIPKSRAARRPIHITDRLARVVGSMGLGEASDWVFMNEAGRQVAENKTLLRLKRYAMEAGVLVEKHPRTGKRWSTLKWHWLRHYHRTRAHVSQIRREVSKVAMGHAADAIHDHYRGLDRFAFHAEYAKFDSGIDDTLLNPKDGTQ
jgi:site-specific recombinase XerD